MQERAAEGEFALPSEVVDVDGIPLRVSRLPGGVDDPARALICIPGYAATGESFARLAPLARCFDLRLLTPPESSPLLGDPIGWYSALVASYARRFDRPALLGTSYGGPIALRAASQLGDLLGRLVLVSTYARLRNPLQHFIPLLGALEVGIEVIRPLAVRVVAGRGLDAAGSRELLRETGSVGRPEKHARLVSALTCDLESEATRITVPTLVLHGTADLVVPLARGRRLAALLPHAALQLIPKAGHVPYLTHAAAVLAKLEPFLERV